MKTDDIEGELRKATHQRPSQELDQRIERLVTNRLKKEVNVSDVIGELVLEGLVSAALIVYAVFLGLKP